MGSGGGGAATESMARDLVWIRTFSDAAAADRARELLRAKGIESVVSGNRSDGADERVPATSVFRLGVRAEDVRVALKLVWGETEA